MDTLEFATDFTMEGDTLHGIVHVFGTRALRDGLLHEMAPTAFDKAIKSKAILAFYSHDKAKPLGKPSLEIRDGALHYGLALGHQSYAQDLRENMAQGLMNHMSFGMFARKWEDIRQRNGSIVRVHTDSDVYDISPVSMPAFSGTAAMLNAADPLDIERATAKIRHEVWRNMYR